MSLTMDLGKVGVLYKGTHDSTQTYERNDIVMSNGSGYIAKQNVPVGVDISNSSYWGTIVVGADSSVFATKEYTASTYATIDDVSALQAAVGSPLVASTVAEMTDTDKIYVYVGSETGYTAGNWYYYNGSAWTSGGVYNSTAFETDTTLSVAGMAADAKATGDAIGEVEGYVSDLKESFENEVGYINVEFATGYYTNNTVGSAGNVKTASTGYVSGIAECGVGDIVYANLGGANVARAWAYLDSNYNVLLNANAAANSNNVIISAAPEGTAYIVVNNRLSIKPDGYYCRISKIAPNKSTAEHIKNINSEIALIKEKNNSEIEYYLSSSKIAFTSGKYIDNSANPVDTTKKSDSAYKCALISCEFGDLFTITASGGDTARAYSFIDEDGNILSFCKANAEIKNVCVKAPFGTKYLIINDNSDSDSYYGNALINKNSIDDDNENNEFGKTIRTGYEQYRIGSAKIVRENNNRPLSKFFKIERNKTYEIVFVGGDVRKTAFINDNYTAETTVTLYREYSLDTDRVRFTVEPTRVQEYIGVNYAISEDIADGADVYLIELFDYNMALNDKVTMVMKNNYDIEYAHAPLPLPLKNYLGNTLNTHAKVLYFNPKLFGHYYWMAYTPYPNVQSQYENPCIAYSEDGYNWVNIANNPIDDVHTDTSAKNYNSDTHLVYNSNSGLLECWYRWVDEDNSVEVIYRKTTSDGITWSTREELYRSTGSISKVLSPSVIYDGTKYLIWVVDNSTHNIKYYESVSGTNWSYVKSIDLAYSNNNKQYHVWHIDVDYIDNKYVLLAMCREIGQENVNSISALFLADSEDNATYSTPTIIMDGRANKWDKSLYRSCIVKSNNYRIYYSGYNLYTYQLGITESDSLDKFIGAIT